MKTLFLKSFTLGISTTLLFSQCSKPTNSCFDYSPSNPSTSSTITFNAACSENASFFTGILVMVQKIHLLLLSRFHTNILCLELILLH